MLKGRWPQLSGVHGDAAGWAGAAAERCWAAWQGSATHNVGLN